MNGPPPPAGTVHDLRLAPAALLVWAVAWWGVAVPPPQTRLVATTLLGVGAFVLVVHLVLVRRGRARAVAPATVAGVVLTACACAAAVLALTSWQADRRQPTVVVDTAARSGSVDAELVVAGDPVTGQGDQPWQREQVRVRVVLERVEAAGSSTAVRVPVSLSGDQRWAGVRWGGRLRAELTLEPAPAGAPYAFFARATGPGTVLQEPRWWWLAAERLRSGLVVAAGGDGTSDAAGLLPGLVVGDTSGQPPDLADDMRTAGLTHLTAVSGANITIICGGVLLLCVLLRVGRRTGAVLAAGALIALVVVARPEPSVLRAAVMGAVGLVGLLLGRRGGGLSALAVAVVVVLLADPWLARAPGFRLSVLATGALVLCSLPWARAMGRVLPRSLALVLSVPAAAQAAVTPALVGLDPVVSVYALPANVLAAPAVAPATVIGVVAALLSLVHPATAAVVAVPGLWCAGWIALVARTTADLPSASLPWPGGVAGVLAAGGATLLLLGLAAVALRALPDRRVAGQRWAPWPERPGSLRAGPAGVVAALVAIVLAAAWLLPGTVGAWPGAGWAVVVCDVGQGETVLVRAGPDSAVVVDTGPDPAPTRSCLRRAGIRSVPLLVLTHLHADHVGGLEGVAAAATVAEVWTAPRGMPEHTEQQVERWAQTTGVPLVRPGAGTSVRVGDVLVDVLAPAPTTADPDGDGDAPDVNDAGLVVRLDTPDLRVLAVGDIGSAVQRRLLRDPAALRADVTTVAHHGSADQLPAFYAAVGARVAVASAGRDNSYGHPSPQALDVVSTAGARVLSTAVHGDVALRPVPAGDAAAGPGDAAARPEDARASVAVRVTRRAPRGSPRVPA